MVLLCQHSFSCCFVMFHVVKLSVYRVRNDFFLISNLSGLTELYSLYNLLRLKERNSPWYFPLAIDLDLVLLMQKAVIWYWNDGKNATGGSNKILWSDQLDKYLLQLKQAIRKRIKNNFNFKAKLHRISLFRAFIHPEICNLTILWERLVKL